MKLLFHFQTSGIHFDCFFFFLFCEEEFEVDEWSDDESNWYQNRQNYINIEPKLVVEMT